MASSFLEEMKWRGLYQDATPEADHLLASGSIRAYVGFDPTAPSLTIGNLVPLMLLVHLKRTGHQPVALLGGATGRIGDPSGKDEERQLLSEAVLDENTAQIEKQIRHVLRKEPGQHEPLVVNNYDWFEDFRFIDFLRDAGKHLTLRYMMNKESVRRRLETGISFTEFAYQLLQGYDFAHLHQQYHVKMQMGGSDQWGNMTTGIELIRRMHGGEAGAMTAPLLVREDGSKFGKSAGQNIWLSPEYTSPYQFYQFWINCTDEESARFTRIFSTRSRENIEALEAEHRQAPQKRLLQKALAQEVTARIHDQEAMEQAEKATEILFGKGTSEALAALDENTLLEIFAGVPQYTLSRSRLESGISVLSLIAEETGVFESKGEARRMIRQNGLSINKTKQPQEDREVNTAHLLQDRYLLIQKGKKQYHLVVAV